MNAQMMTPEHSMPTFHEMQPKSENSFSFKRAVAPANTTANLNKELSSALKINVKAQSQRRRNILVH
jgi:hypothetical protein